MRAVVPASSRFRPTRPTSSEGPSTPRRRYLGAVEPMLALNRGCFSWPPGNGRLALARLGPAALRGLLQSIDLSFELISMRAEGVSYTPRTFSDGVRLSCLLYRTR